MTIAKSKFLELSACMVLVVATALTGVAQEKRPTLPFVVAGCVETKEPPTIDGRLDDQAWQRAGKASRFVLLNGGDKAREQTLVYLLYDRSNLFLGIHCEESRMESLQATVRDRDTAAVGMDDSIEVFLIPPESRFLKQRPERERYFHVMLNALATQYDEVGYSNPKSWDAKWTAATSKGRDYWEAEIAIPFSELSTTPPQAGETWKVNFNRGEKRLGENSGWAAVYGSFHDPAHFGRIVFVREPEEAQRLEGTALREGLLLPKVKETRRKVRETAASLHALNASLAAADEVNRTLQRSAEHLAQLKTRIQSLPPSEIVGQWEIFDNELIQLEKDVDATADKTLLLRSYTREQLTGKAPSPPYSVFVSPAITNEKLLPHRFPRSAKPAREISVQACAGEFEPATFSVYAAQNLRGVRGTVTPLRPSALVLRPASPVPSVDVRIVKCWFQAGVQVWETGGKLLTPELLLKDADLVRVDLEKEENFLRTVDANGRTTYVPISTKDSSHLSDVAPEDAETLQPVDISANFLQQFWLTVHVPEGTPPGEYRGSLRIEPAGLPARSLPLKVNVLSFHLDEPLLQYSIYYRGVLTEDGKGSISSEAKSPQQYEAEMRDLKEHGVLYPTLYQGYHSKLLPLTMELREKAGLPKAAIYTLGIGTGAPGTPEELEGLKSSVKQWLDFAKQRGYGDVYVYGIDEASGDMLTKERSAFQAVHEAGAKVFVACSSDFWERVGDLLDLPVWSGTPDPAMARKVHGVKHKIWNYGNPQVGNEEPETYRRNYGLVLWKAGYDGACDYAYQHSFHHIWDDFDDPAYRDHVFAYPTVDGVIDTIQWEGFREGVNDVRYVTTLEQRIAKAPDSKKGIAKQARTWLNNLKPETADLYETRAKMTDWIQQLR